MSTQTCAQAFIVALFIIAQMEMIQMFISWWMDKQKVVYLSSGYSTIKRNDIDTCYMNGPKSQT